MKYLGLAATLLCGLTMTSCFKEEPLNAECDITEAYIHSDNPTEMFFNVTDTLVRVYSTEDNVKFAVRRSADLTALSPCFRITEGATIEPESGSTHDFSDGKTVTYTVTSQDKAWQRHYVVSVKPRVVTVPDVIKYSFENYHLNTNRPVGKYYVWSDLDENGRELGNWATGNGGFNLSGVPFVKPNKYPTAPDENGVEGACVKLTTSKTGSIAAGIGKPIAAGNLFLGSFVTDDALQHPMEATHFGLPTNVKPTKLNGYYKYQRGAKFIDKNEKPLEGRQDYGTIYAVLYDNHDENGNSIVLDGNNVQTHGNIVALAKLPDIDNTPEWTHFSIDFVYSKDVDLEKLANFGYSLAIVCSSSVDGAIFEGAVGSTLWVDELSVDCAKAE